MLSIQKFTVENLEEGCITDEPHPVFAYSLSSDRQNVMIDRAVIQINGWEYQTREQVGIIYQGEKLQPLHAYTAELRVTDNYGDTAEARLIFETGFMGERWRGNWITDLEYYFIEKHASPKPMTFRRTFSLSTFNQSSQSSQSNPARGKIRQARIFASALGVYELNLNGVKIGQDYFAPGFTSYHNQLQYQIYDITGQLREENELIAVVGGGWAVGAYTYKRMNRLYADRQAFLCELRVTYEDNSVEMIGTDEQWRVTENGNYQAAEFYDGEIYDATVNLNNLNNLNNNNLISWRNAGIETLKFSPKLIAQYGAPVRGHEILKPVSRAISPSGMLIYDFGQNFAGVIRAEILNAAKGQKIIFSHAEILMNGELYTKPLRSAKQQAVYICTDGKQIYSPRMTYMGFRYVGVTGIAKENINLSAVALYSDMTPNGDFKCSHEMLNQMQNCVQWGAKSNFMDIPTDCPQRDERLGWTGDIALFSPVAAWNFDSSRFFTKWLRDVKSEQTRGGGIPMIVPQVKIRRQFEMLFPMAVDHWGDACILVPWAEYQARGNRNILREFYPVMKKYLKACQFWAGLFSLGKNKYIWKYLFHYGDWCAPDTDYNGWLRRGQWTATACLARSSAIVSEIAGLFNQQEDKIYYQTLSQNAARAYREILMDPDCKIQNEFQTGYILPLYYNLLDNPEDREKAAGHLVRLVREGGWHIRTGFPGTPYALFALADNGYIQDAYQMLLTDTCPSWLYEIKTGGTTFWERWDALREDGSCNLGDDDGGEGMVSFNHYACGAAGAFLYRRIAGIEPLKGGYQKCRIAPLPGGGLTWAEGRVNTPYGEIISKWEIQENIFTLTVTIPPCVEAVVILPGGETRTTGSGVWTYQTGIENDI